MNLLSEMEIDAIGEILNISMGSAATAISSMLDKQVMITTPKVSVQMFDDIDYSSLEPALAVKITYVEGITGSNTMVFKQRDMQLILNQLMGLDEPPTDTFTFDELSMSAACEVMNQMMGSSATALSEFLGKAINISTPNAVVMNAENTFKKVAGFEGDEDIVAVTFSISISDIMNSEFVSVMSCDLAKMIVSQLMLGNSVEPEPAASPTPVAPSPVPAPVPAPVTIPNPTMGSVATSVASPPLGGVAAPTPAAPLYASSPPPLPGIEPPGPVYGGSMVGQYPPYGYPPYGYPGYPPYGYPGMPPMGMMPPGGEGGGGSQPSPLVKPGVNVQNVQFPNFSGQKASPFAPLSGGNIELIMNVPLSVSVEIGKTKKKIKDIMDFSQGTVIELEKQAGAPVDIVVNGQLIARGDVVVIDDNFGVRITEILGIKDLLNAVDGSKN